MVGSTDSMDFSPELTIPEERESIPLRCWQDVCLSDIWIPSHLLPSRKKPPITRTANIIFHRLEKKDSTKYLGSFSVYSEEDIFLSDSDEDILGCNDDKKCVSSDHQHTYKQDEYLEVKRKTSNLKTLPSVDNLCNIGTETTSEVDACGTANIIPEQCKESSSNLDVKRRTSNLKTLPSVDNLCNIGTEITSGVNSCGTVKIVGEQCKESGSSQKKAKGSHISLNDILDDTPQFNINEFRTKGNEFLGIQAKKLELNQKKNKKKKKGSKHITLDEFLDDYSEADHQNDCCNSYFQKLLREKDKIDGVQLRSAAEFPDLTTNDLKFVHSEKLETKSSEHSLKTLSKILCQSNEINENTNIDCDEKKPPTVPETEYIRGKLVIENIPNEVSEDDIYSILCGYGEIINFCLEEADGEFLKAYVEIDLTCDIDWIIECLNGTEPFGASTKTLKCYKQE